MIEMHKEEIRMDGIEASMIGEGKEDNGATECGTCGGTFCFIHIG